MKRMRLCLLMIIIFLSGYSYADELKSASRFDIDMKPFKYGLEGEIVRAIDDYRTAVNQTGLQPSLDRQLRAETDRIRQLLQSRGYYRADIQSQFSERKNKPVYNVVLGKRYEIASVSITGNFQPENNDWQSLKLGQPLSAVLVLDQQSKLKQYIEASACYFNVAVNHEVMLDEENNQANVVFQTQVSQPSRFSAVEFVGVGEINQKFLTRVTGIRAGDCYRRSVIDSAVIGLFDTGLFRQVRPNVSRNRNDEQQEEQQVVVSFQVEKRKKRTLSATAGWESELGLGASVGWLHRDLFGRAQNLSLNFAVQSAEQSFAAKIIVPSFFDRRNRFSWSNELTHKNADVESYQYDTTASLERKASSKNYYEYGIGYRQIIERVDNSDWTTYQQIRFPLQYRYDSVTNPFNPQSGFRDRFQVEPVFDINDDFTPFVKTAVGVQNFTATSDGLIIASRARWDAIWYGDILGSSSTNIPESELYTMGGSTSVRGYGYQSIKLPTDDGADDLEGGSQRWLVVNEVRAQVNDSWGVVAFWDAGKVGKEISDISSGRWYNGMGVGARYFTRFAPLRLDVAFPLNKREADDRFLVYVSLGQAF